MNTPSAITDASTNLPAAHLCEQRVADARKLFQRTLAAWASDVLVIRQHQLHEPAWDRPARGSLTLMHPPDSRGGFSQAA
jgi:hypothetical protein